MSQFAENILLGSVCFFIGIAVGQVAAFWAMLTAENKATELPKPRVVEHGESRTIGACHNPAPEFEPLHREKVKPSQINNNAAQLSALGRRAEDWTEHGEK